MTTVVNVRRHQYDVYCGRGRAGANMLNTPLGERGWLGNPVRLPLLGDSLFRFEQLFLARLERDPDFRAAVLALRARRLACFCVPEPWTPADGGQIVCHAQLIARWIDAQ